ncbi:MAG: bacteriohemerythrin [Candidatus Competibacteraceae bacterium]|nr:bacteriohemerythrin [Candidatus Competibacteraceae bacterium]MCB1820655.1 bacteriohemerythrin [Candidatus Competibacteraceae bacterium]
MMTTQLEIFPWNENFATGIEEIDLQHKRLVDLLNVLVSHLAFNADPPALNKVFDELKDYTVVHFSTEERIWHEYFKNDPWEIWHKDAHGDFIAQVLEIKQKETEMPMDDVIAELVGFLTRWLALHIIESDKRMAKVVLALPSGISFERAKEQANEEMAGATRVLIGTVMGMYDKLANRTIELTREISRRIKAEAELRDTQDKLLELKNTAIKASQAKSAFLANMSHEIRTPMSGVIGMSEVLLNTRLTDEQRKMACVIRDSAHTQLGILNDILDFSKIEAGKLDLSIEPFALADVVEKSCAALIGQARQREVALRYEVDPHIPRILEGDALRVRQILSNFTTNAIKFSSGLERAGDVEVVARLASEAEGQVWVELAVRDNGIGMDAATLERVFQPFTQANMSIARKYGGTGLGLVISTRLTEVMGGEIRVDSTPDVGSTFTARLPFSRTEKVVLSPATDTQDLPLPQATVPPRGEAVQQGRLILVAEDNVTNQEVIRQQLTLLGYSCDVAPDGRAAFNQWLTGDYGLVLSDLHMPHLDGYQLAQAIRVEEGKRGTGRTPILALTANVLPGEAERCQAAGMDGYLAKPVALPDLQAALGQWLPEPAVDSVPVLSIMLLDDDTFMHDLISSILEEIGYSNVACYETGESALDALDASNAKPNAILLDINMPGMDGIEFVEQLAKRQYSGCLILVSGEDEMMLRSTEKLAQEVHLFVTGSVQKPPLPQRLADLLGQCGARQAPSRLPTAKRTYKSYDAATLRSAIANGELVNYYQPKVALPSGEWIGVETLVRWKHPEDGLVFPDQFIPVAEANGIIGDLTRAVLKESIRQVQLWRDEGLTLRVAVNVSMEDLTDMAFADFVIEQATNHNVPPQAIVLEVTEGRLMRDFTTALHVLTRLRLKRFRLSIDDFGTGHSSLAQLRDLPFDELKIDQSFTRNAGKDARLRAIFGGSLEMAKQLHMEVVAEGVEDEEDWAFLLTTDTQIAQGYFISRPLPAEELVHWYEQWRHRQHPG